MSNRFVVQLGSSLGHDCCFAATIIDSVKMEEVCECLRVADATMICEALNYNRETNTTGYITTKAP